MKSIKAMKTEQRKRTGRVALAATVCAALAGGALLLIPDGDQGKAPSGPATRAMAAAAAGAPAALPDLVALIRDRESWVGAHPKDEQAWAVLGSAYVERGLREADSAYYPKADQALRRSLALLPGERGNSAALVGLASLANARQDYPAARKFAETARARKPADSTVYPVLIDAYNGLGAYPAASKAMGKLRKLRSGAPVLARAAEVYRNQGWREDAAANAAEAVALAGSPAEKAASLYALGELAWERGEPQEALGHYNAALEASPGHHQSLAGRARALAALGRTDEAYTEYQAATKKLPLPEYALELGELYDSQGLDGDARTQYAALSSLASRDRANGVNEELLLARLEADHGDPQTAVARLKGEWGRQRRNAYVADALGWALFRAGRSEEGLAYAKRATEKGPRNAMFSYHRGEIERSLEMPGAARRHLAEALRINPYFSPLLAPHAQEVLDALGEPPAGGPQNMDGEG